MSWVDIDTCVCVCDQLKSFVLKRITIVKNEDIITIKSYESIFVQQFLISLAAAPRGQNEIAKLYITHGIFLYVIVITGILGYQKD